MPNANTWEWSSFSLPRHLICKESITKIGGFYAILFSQCWISPATVVVVRYRCDWSETIDAYMITWLLMIVRSWQKFHNLRERNVLFQLIFKLRPHKERKTRKGIFYHTYDIIEMTLFDTIVWAHRSRGTDPEPYTVFKLVKSNNRPLIKTFFYW